MAADPWKLFGPANERIGEDFNLATDTFRMVLVTAAYTPDQSLHDTWSDISANEVANGNGYVTHGELLTATHVAAALVSTFDCDDQSWAASTITAKYAVIVRNALVDGNLAATDVPIAFCDLENGGGSVSTTNGPFNVNIHANGVFTRTAS